MAQPASPSTRPLPLRPAEAFTLIELLVVIAIIAILASLAFPAVTGALESGKKAQARNDVTQLAAAIKAFQLEYGRLPISGSSGTDMLNARNEEIIANLTQSNALNPRGTVFFEPKPFAKGKGGTNNNGTYLDPWSNAYTFMLDTSYDNKILALGRTNFTTVVISSPGGTNTRDTNKIISNIK
jgi:prepilin-type N-terminal cleavage/methylation domain-containing protein